MRAALAEAAGDHPHALVPSVGVGNEVRSGILLRAEPEAMVGLLAALDARVREGPAVQGLPFEVAIRAIHLGRPGERPGRDELLAALDHLYFHPHEGGAS